ncbi:hypothetical protein SK128_013780 [Halocaridina rubra]|uniref:C2H2-type domain-containing protein n=1 Tax=Halocaridina rubra TaxID=373956 RepID=A0AAN8XNL8_HALRR
MESNNLPNIEYVLPNHNMARRLASNDEKVIVASCSSPETKSSLRDGENSYPVAHEGHVIPRRTHLVMDSGASASHTEQYPSELQPSEHVCHIQKRYRDQHETEEHPYTQAPEAYSHYIVNSSVNQDVYCGNVTERRMPSTEADVIHVQTPSQVSEIFHSHDRKGSSYNTIITSTPIYSNASKSKRKLENYSQKSSLENPKFRKLIHLDESYTLGYTSDKSDENRKLSTSKPFLERQSNVVLKENELHMLSGHPNLKEKLSGDLHLFHKDVTPNLKPLSNDLDVDSKSSLSLWEEKRLQLERREHQLFEAEEAMKQQEEKAQECLRVALEQQEKALNEREEALKQREAAVQRKLEQAKRLMEDSKKIFEVKRYSSPSSTDSITVKSNSLLSVDNTVCFQNARTNSPTIISSSSGNTGECTDENNLEKSFFNESNEYSEDGGSSDTIIPAASPLFENAVKTIDPPSKPLSLPQAFNTCISSCGTDKSGSCHSSLNSSFLNDRYETASNVPSPKVIRTYGRPSRCRTTSEMVGSSSRAKLSLPQRCKSVTPVTKASYDTKAFAKEEKSIEETIINGGASVTITPLETEHRLSDRSEPCQIASLGNRGGRSLSSAEATVPLDIKPEDVSIIQGIDNARDIPSNIMEIVPKTSVSVDPVPLVDKNISQILRQESACLSHDVQMSGSIFCHTKQTNYHEKYQTSQNIAGSNESFAEERILCANSPKMREIIPVQSLTVQGESPAHEVDSNKGISVDAVKLRFHGKHTLPIVSAPPLASSSISLPYSEKSYSYDRGEQYILSSSVKPEIIGLTKDVKESHKQGQISGPLLPGDIFYAPGNRVTQVQLPQQPPSLIKQVLKSQPTLPQVKASSHSLPHIPSLPKGASLFGNCKLTLVNQVTCHEAPLASNAPLFAHPHTTLQSKPVIPLEVSSGEILSAKTSNPFISPSSVNYLDASSNLSQDSVSCRRYQKHTELLPSTADSSKIPLTYETVPKMKQDSVSGVTLQKTQQSSLLRRDEQFEYLPDQQGTQMVLPSETFSDSTHLVEGNVHAEEASAVSIPETAFEIFKSSDEEPLSPSQHEMPRTTHWSAKSPYDPVNENEVTKLGEYDPISRTITTSNPVFLQSLLSHNLTATVGTVSISEAFPRLSHALNRVGKNSERQVSAEIQTDVTSEDSLQTQQNSDDVLILYDDKRSKETTEMNVSTDEVVSECDRLHEVKNRFYNKGYGLKESPKCTENYDNRSVNSDMNTSNIESETCKEVFISTGILGGYNQITHTLPEDENMEEPPATENFYSDNESESSSQSQRKNSDCQGSVNDARGLEENSTYSYTSESSLQKMSYLQDFTAKVSNTAFVAEDVGCLESDEINNHKRESSENTFNIENNISGLQEYETSESFHNVEHVTASDMGHVNSLSPSDQDTSMQDNIADYEADRSENEYILPNSLENFSERKLDVFKNANYCDERLSNLPETREENNFSASLIKEEEHLRESFECKGLQGKTRGRGRLHSRGRGRGRRRGRGRGRRAKDEDSDYLCGKVLIENESITCNQVLSECSVTENENSNTGIHSPVDSTSKSEIIEHVSHSGRKLKLNSYFLNVVSRGTGRKVCKSTPKSKMSCPKELPPDVTDLDNEQTHFEKPSVVQEKKRRGRKPKNKGERIIKDAKSDIPVVSVSSDVKSGDISIVPDKDIKCGKCDSIFPSQGKFLYHVRYEHNGLARPSGDSQEFLELERRKILTKTMRLVKRLKCENCNKVFKSMGGYIIHCNRYCAITVGDAQEQCKTCGKLFPLRSIEYHVKKWHSPKPGKSLVESTVEVPRPQRKAAKNCTAIFDAWKSNSSDVIDKEKDDGTHSDQDFEDKKLYTRTKIHIPLHIIKNWDNDIRLKGIAYCPNTDCTYVIKSVKSGSAHFFKCRFNNITRNYKCKLCKYTCKTCADIRAHIIEKHEDSLVPPEDSESDTSGADPETFETIKKNNFRQVSSQLKPFEPAFHWTLNYILENYSNLLFPDFKVLVDDWTTLDEDHASHYIPKAHHSPKFKFNFVSKSGTEFTDWQTLEVFDGTFHRGGWVLFSGGPTYASAWCPLPLNESINAQKQYLALSTLLSPDREYQVLKAQSHPGLIQIWEFCSMEESDHPPQMLFGIAHNFGNVWGLAWCPSGTFESKINTSSMRLGLLAAACSDGTVRIFAIPQSPPEELQGNSKIYRVEPSVTLRSSIVNDDDAQCLKVDWFCGKEHQFLAGAFSAGYVCIWDLNTSSPLLCVNDSRGLVLYPIHCFLAHNGVCCTVAFCPSPGGRHVITGGFDRTYRFWDLENTSMPLSVARKGLITDAVCLLHWPGSFISFDDVFGLANTCTLYRDSGYFNISSRNVLSSNAPIWALSGSNWLNSIVQGDSAGEVIVTVQQLLLKSYEHDKVPPKRKAPLLTVCMESVKSHEGENHCVVEAIKNYTSTEESPSQKQNGSEEAESSSTVYREMPKLYHEMCQEYGIVFQEQDYANFANIPEEEKSLRRQAKSMEPGPVDIYPFKSVNTVSWNNNLGSHSLIFVGTQAVTMLTNKGISCQEWVHLSDEIGREMQDYLVLGVGVSHR